MRAKAGGLPYLKFIFRRERLTTPIWLLSFLLFSTGITLAYTHLFATPEDMLLMAQTMTNPAMQALVGPVYGLDSLTPAMLMAQQLLSLMTITVVIMNIFLVIRHTRADEEQGRLEMLRALPIGRLTNPAATLFFAFLTNLALALIIALGLLATNIDGMQAAGAFLYAGSLGAVGFLFAAIALLMAQLFSTARGALTGSFVVMGIFYIMRAFGDMSSADSSTHLLSFISPLGLGLQVSSFYQNICWPLPVLFAQAIVIAVIALLVCRTRDLGEGVIPARTGRQHASAFLQTPLGFTWRLVRGNFIAWSIGMLVIGATYGSVIGEIEQFVQTNEMFQILLGISGDGAEQAIAGEVAASFVALIMVVMAMIAVVPVILIISRLRGEEKQGRLEPIFARSIKRQHLVLLYTIIATLGSAWFILCAALGLYGASIPSGLLDAGETIRSALMYAPAILTLLGLAVFLIGLLPKLTGLVWLVLGYSFMTVYLGPLMSLPDWTAKLSPFGLIPQLPVQEFSAAPLFALSALALVLIFFGIKSFARRDIGRI
ncbi:ABC transporter permease [Candidatus Saccharibacteria bacterium]|nr:ABC transporter permease [Candidatus Saccharibacteria bacterium]